MQATSWRGGDDLGGFVVSSDPGPRLIRLKLRGLWTDETASSFRAALVAAYEQVRAGGRWVVLADIKSYPPQRPSVQAVHAEMMALGARLGVVRSANLVSSMLGQLQIKRLSQESGLPVFSFFTDEKAALAWLLSGRDDPA